MGCLLRTRPREGFKDVSCVGDAAWTDMGDIAADEAVGGGGAARCQVDGDGVWGLLAQVCKQTHLSTSTI